MSQITLQQKKHQYFASTDISQEKQDKSAKYK